METKEEVHEKITELVQLAPDRFDSAEAFRVALEEAIPGSAVVEIARFEPDFVSGSIAYQLEGDRNLDSDESPVFHVAQFESEEGDFDQ